MRERMWAITKYPAFVFKSGRRRHLCSDRIEVDGKNDLTVPFLHKTPDYSFEPD